MQLKVILPAARLKTRSFQVLFEKNTPFKQKIVADKTLYQRRPKHKNMRYD